jgi:protein SCO1
MRRFSLVLLALLPVLAASACGRGGDDGGRFAGVELPDPVDKPHFVLTDTEGEPYDFAAETEGQVALLYFGYTSCPDICPIHLAQVADVLSRPGMPEDVTVVFVSVDPGRDTPAVIRDWLDKFDTDFVGLTGTEAELVAAQEAAHVPVADVQDDGAQADYLVGHAGQVLAYAPDGRGYTAYPFGTRQTQWAHDLPVLDAIRG